MNWNFLLMQLTGKQISNSQRAKVLKKKKKKEGPSAWQSIHFDAKIMQNNTYLLSCSDGMSKP